MNLTQAMNYLRTHADSADTQDVQQGVMDYLSAYKINPDIAIPELNNHPVNPGKSNDTLVDAIYQDYSELPLCNADVWHVDGYSIKATSRRLLALTRYDGPVDTTLAQLNKATGDMVFSANAITSEQDARNILDFLRVLASEHEIDCYALDNGRYEFTVDGDKVPAGFRL